MSLTVDIVLAGVAGLGMMLAFVLLYVMGLADAFSYQLFFSTGAFMGILLIWIAAGGCAVTLSYLSAIAGVCLPLMVAFYALSFRTRGFFTTFSVSGVFGLIGMIVYRFVNASMHLEPFFVLFIACSLVVIALAIAYIIKTTDIETKRKRNNMPPKNSYLQLLDSDDFWDSYTNSTTQTHPQSNFLITTTADLSSNSALHALVSRLNERRKRVLGAIALTLGAVFFAAQFIILYIEEDRLHGDIDVAPIKYGILFCYGLGAIAGGFLLIVVYAAMSRNKPSIIPKSILPGFFSGIVWGLALTAYIASLSSDYLNVMEAVAVCTPCALAFFVALIAMKEFNGTCDAVSAVISMVMVAGIGACYCYLK